MIPQELIAKSLIAQLKGIRGRDIYLTERLPFASSNPGAVSVCPLMTDLC